MHSSSFQIEVYCDWLTPLHVAKLPLVVYEPLTFVIMEQAAGDHAYLHMTMTNTCTLPVAVRSPALLSDNISLTQLHGELPKVQVYKFTKGGSELCPLFISLVVGIHGQSIHLREI